MIGRAAIGNPWIFARQNRLDLPFGEVVRAIRLHVQEMVAYYSEHAGLAQFRKHLKQYVADVPVAEAYLPQLLTVVSLADFEEELRGLETAVPADVPIRELAVHWHGKFVSGVRF